MSRHRSAEIALVGVAESDLGKVPGKTAIQLAAEASRAALADAGLAKSDVDGLFTFGFGRMGAVQFGEYLQIRPRYSDSSVMGGATPVAFIGHATAALSAGLCSVALIAYGSTQASDLSRHLGGFPEDPRLPGSQYERPFGLPLPLGAYALAATRHMAVYGTTSEVPYIVALVELAEGVRLLSNLIGCPPARATVGMPVEVVFEDVSADLALYKFRPADA